MESGKEERCEQPIAAKLEGLPHDQDQRTLKEFYFKLVQPGKKNDTKEEADIKPVVKSRYPAATSEPLPLSPLEATSISAGSSALRDPNILAQLKHLLFALINNADNPKDKEREKLSALIRLFLEKYPAPEPWLKERLNAVLKICEEPLELVHVISAYNFSESTRATMLAEHKASLAAMMAYQRTSLRPVIPSAYVYTSYRAERRLQKSKAPKGADGDQADIEYEIWQEEKAIYDAYKACTQEFFGKIDLSNFLSWSGENHFTLEEFPKDEAEMHERLTASGIDPTLLKAIDLHIKAMSKKFVRRKHRIQKTPSPLSENAAINNAARMVAWEETLNAWKYFASRLPKEQAHYGKTLLNKMFPKQKKTKLKKKSLTLTAKNYREAKEAKSDITACSAAFLLEAQKFKAPKKMLCIVHIGKMERMRRAQAALLNLPDNVEIISANIVLPAPHLLRQLEPPEPPASKTAVLESKEASAPAPSERRYSTTHSQVVNQLQGQKPIVYSRSASHLASDAPSTIAPAASSPQLSDDNDPFRLGREILLGSRRRKRSSDISSRVPFAPPRFSPPSRLPIGEPTIFSFDEDTDLDDGRNNPWKKKPPTPPRQAAPKASSLFAAFRGLQHILHNPLAGAMKLSFHPDEDL